MKFRTHRTLGLRTLCLRAFVVLFSFVLALAIVSAQESKPVGEATKPAEAPVPADPPARSVAAKREVDPKMPDISGTWWIGIGGEFSEAVIERVKDGRTDFVVKHQGVYRFEDRVGKGIREQWMTWSPEAQQFEFENIDLDPSWGACKATLQLLPGNKAMLFKLALNEPMKKKDLAKKFDYSESELDEILNHKWTRTKGPAGKPAASAGTPVAPETSAAAKPVADVKMPDISGTWRTGSPGRYGEAIIRRVEDGTADFAFEKQNVKDAPAWNVKWSPATRRFEGTLPSLPKSKGTGSLTLSPLADGKTLRVTISFDEQAKKEILQRNGRTEGAAAEQLAKQLDQIFQQMGNQEWVRKETSVDTPTSVAALDNPVKPSDANPDKQTASQKQVKIFSLANGSAVDYGKLLKDLFANVDITADARTNSIIVMSMDEEQLQVIEAILLRLDESQSIPAATQSHGAADETRRTVAAPTQGASEGRVTTVMRLQSSDAVLISRQLEDVFANAVIAADSATNSILISADRDQTRTITTLVKKLDASPSKPTASKTDPAISFTRSTSPPSADMPNSPEIRKLSEQISEYEAKSRQLADSIRELSRKGGDQPLKLIEARSELQKTLAAALAAKFQLEQLQIKSLEQRLMRLKAQIGPRQALSNQIIERRARELIEGDVTRWNAETAQLPKDTNRQTGQAETSSILKTASSAKWDEIAIDLYGGSGVLPGLSKNPNHSKLIQNLNALKGVVTNFREAGEGAAIAMAIVSDPSQRCLRETQRTQKASELRAAIDSALKAAGIQNIRWEENADEKEVRGTDAAATKYGSTKATLSVQPDVTQVHFAGPRGMEVLIDGESTVQVAPTRHNFRRHVSQTQRFVLSFGNAPGHPNVQFAGLLDIYPSHAKTVEFLFNNPVPLMITEEDIQRAWDGELLIKVVYLPDPQVGQLAISAAETVVSSRLTPGADPLGEAEQRGTVLAILQLAKNFERFGVPAPKLSELSSKPSTWPMSVESGSPDTERTPSPFPSYQDVATRLATMNQSITEAEEKLKFTERLAEKGYATPDAVLKARRQVDDATRNRKLIQDEYAAIMRDLELQVESAQIDLDSEKKEADRVEQLKKSNVISAKEFDEAQRRLKQAKLTLERLKVRHDLYKKAGEGLGAEDLLNPKLSQTPVLDGPLDNETAEKLIWEKLGLRLDRAANPTLLPTKFRGGLQIGTVDEKRFLQTDGPRAGDILVGLHRWETTSIDNVVFILRNPDTQPKPPKSAEQLKAYLVRDGKVLYTNIEFNGITPSKPKNSSPQSSTKSFDEWLVVLSTSRKSHEVIAAAQEVAKLATGSNAERAAPALLATAEFFDASTQANAIVQYEIKEAMKQLAPSVKMPAIVNAMRDGPPRVKQFAIYCVDALKDYTAEKDFPALVEQVWKVAAGTDHWPRVSSLRLLGETLPITKLDPAEFTTEERREMARRLTEFVPRDKVIPLLVAALNDKQIDVALEAAERFTKLREETKDADLLAKLVDVLANVTKGKLGDVAASRSQRAQALSALMALNSRAAPAVPTLIELLKSDDPDLKPIEGTVRSFPAADFTRARIITALEKIGTAAKDALPDLEAAWATIAKKEKEDALLSPNTKAQGELTSSRLRQAINRIKGQGGRFGF